MGRTKEKYKKKKRKEFIKQLELFSNMEQFKFVYINNEKTNFFISSMGRIFTINYKKQGEIHMLKTYLDDDCYEQIALKYKGKNYCFKIHKLVALYFIPKPDDATEVHHKDGNTLNNKVTNLQWLTKEEHALITKIMNQYDVRIGEDSPLCKYSREQMMNVCRLLYENTLSLKEISDETGVPYHTINLMRNRANSRKDVKYEYDISNYNQFKNIKYSDELIHNVCKLLEKYKEIGTLLTNPTKCDEDISNKFNINKSVVKSVRLHKRRKNISKNYNF